MRQFPSGLLEISLAPSPLLNWKNERWKIKCRYKIRFQTVQVSILICGSSEGEEGALAGYVDECMPLTCCPEQGISIGNFIYEREK